MIEPAHQAGRGASGRPAPSARRRGRGLVGAAVAAAALLGGCGGSADDAAAGPAGGALEVRLVIPDVNIRQPDVPCSGARAFRFAHPGASFTVEDPGGHEVATGELPEGRSVQAFTFDMGDARQPTVCVMMLEVHGVDGLDGHALVIGDRRPVPIVPNRSLDDIPEVVLR